MSFRPTGEVSALKVSGEISTYSILSFHSLEFKYIGGFSAKQAGRQRERGVDLAFQNFSVHSECENPSGVDRTLNDSADSVCFLPPTPPKPSSSLFIIALHPPTTICCRRAGTKELENIREVSTFFFQFRIFWVFFPTGRATLAAKHICPWRRMPS